MPPKRAGTRRAGATARSDVSIILGHSSPSITNLQLPDVPTQPSWAYGAPAPVVLPRRLTAKRMDLAEVAESIDQTIREARKRDQQLISNENDASNQPNTRLRKRSAPANRSPVRRRTRRAPTPDQAQLLDELRDVTVSPNQGRAELSTATPTPPIPHTLSTISSPASLQAEQLYPTPLQRVGSPARNHMPLENSTQNGTDDNESVVSWTVERDIHDDDLQRTRSTRYRNKAQRKNITAPPRRFSGLAFANETILEEDEPDSRLSLSKARSREPTVESQARSEPGQPSPQETEPEKSTAPARTIIPRFFTRKSPSQESTAPLSDQSLTAARLIPEISFSPPGKQALRVAGILILTALSLFSIYCFGDRLADLSREIISRPFHNQAPLNTSDPEVMNNLNNQMMKLGAQVSSMSKELRTIKSEVHDVPAPTVVVKPGPIPPKKPNFLNINLGVIVDEQMTNPTVRLTDRERGPSQDPRPEENGPLAALLPWDDHGDCWCSAPRDGMSQLGLHLARGIVPEEVVVEHIPKRAAISPETAPKEMELWVRYRVNISTSSDLPSEAESATWYTQYLNRLLNRFSSSESEYQSPMLAERFSLHDYIMGVLRHGYSKEPESAYWNDTLLGPSFYRVAKWKYNIHGPHHIQEYSLDAIIDQPDIRVDRVVFRVKSNWGGNYTCLYRLKLYGHL